MNAEAVNTVSPLDGQALHDLNGKVVQVFKSLAIDKRRLPASQLTKRGIPAYVAEWVLESVVPGQGELSIEEATKVRDWAARVIPGPGEQNVIKHRLAQGQTVKVLTPLQAEVRLKKGKDAERVAQLSLLGIGDAYIADALLEDHPDLLRHGMWGVVELGALKDGVAVLSFKPMQASVNLQLYKAARRQFNLHEWRALLLTSLGFDPSAFTEWQQTLLLCRLLPLVQKNMHLMELAPKGTGKSFTFENISPKVRLISGGNISPAVLFVNNASGQWGLLARFKVVVLDEVQTARFEKPEEIVGGLKGYLANGKLTRGGLHETASDCGFVILANISLDDQQRPVRELLVEELPSFLQETAFLDRIRALLPGWQLPKLSSKLLVGLDSALTVGLKSDFFGDALIALREDLEAESYAARNVHLAGARPYSRNEESVRAIAAGLMKIQFPHGEPTPLEFHRYCVKPALQLRQLIWDQLYTLDSEYRQYEHGLNVQ
ncbi:BREX system Lon protease-like protein BrxL [Deinococcus radiopugnans]|uniref:ATP-dependent Lon protease n=1 Tax=Deinococcus radiopugnans ATCC 19172 TaxID=585398 RepID=A0A5C4Y986_9DEIO|nr:BREX system Lon protease-like protein BrxL [Deinococcus radiopugnans]MBB6017425.1 ATP-dependent Lon protease [Deinococcus radiopugnans ATCC 19172]TNM71961.1 BREX system Lon protease-like protein BrxL [Deinococcus radiopugnans ATCC 19172]